jgi:hypothetical protein
VRQVPPGSREDAERLIGASEIDDDRRVLYGLLFLGGMRLGEGCGRRWSDLDTNARPLWLLHVHDQYDGAPLKTARDEDTCERFVPVHPELQRLLEWWGREGFARVFGRAPRAEDLIVPDRRHMRSRTKNQALKGLYRDCVRIGIPRRGTHSGRRWLMTYARSDGARGEIIERITHNAAGAMIDRYTYFGWAPLCEELSKLRIALRLPSEAPSRVHSGDGSKDPLDDHVNDHQVAEGTAKANDFSGLPVEAPGVEAGRHESERRKTAKNGEAMARRDGLGFPVVSERAEQLITQVIRDHEFRDTPRLRRAMADLLVRASLDPA